MRILIALAFIPALFAATPADAIAPQPYPVRGCVEAWRAPHSVNADHCREIGWTVHRGLVVSPRGWVRFNALPHCPYEDGGENQPCTWNIGPGTDGNGIGLAYWIDRNDRTHYVRGVR